MAYTRRGYIFFSSLTQILYPISQNFSLSDHRFFLGINQTFAKWWHKRIKDVIESTTNLSIFFERLICSLRCLLASLSPLWKLLDKDTGELSLWLYRIAWHLQWYNLTISDGVRYPVSLPLISKKKSNDEMPIYKMQTNNQSPQFKFMPCIKSRTHISNWWLGKQWLTSWRIALQSTRKTV
jgi:hypothetical protein